MHVLLRTEINDFLIWQVTAKVAAEPSCVHVRSHDTIFYLIRFRQKSYDVKSRIQKLFQNRLAFYFHRQSDENRIMRTVKDMFTCSLIFKISFCHFVYFLLSPLFRFLFLQHLKKIQKQTHNI